jgi:acetylornithine deacetylase
MTGTDIPWFNQTVEGQKRYLYGPGSILVAHSDHEMLTEGQLYDAVDGYQKIILHALGKDPCEGC